MNNYLIEGLSGTGKTTVGEELLKRGFRVIDADKAFGYYGIRIKLNKSLMVWKM